MVVAANDEVYAVLVPYLVRAVHSPELVRELDVLRVS